MSNDEYQQKQYWDKEILKCKESPYYLFTNYITVNNEKAETFLTEEEFNNIFKSYGKR